MGRTNVSSKSLLAVASTVILLLGEDLISCFSFTTSFQMARTTQKTSRPTVIPLLQLHLLPLERVLSSLRKQKNNAL
jgi:hypothetical protein